jgi:hypothetical protein
VEFNSANTDALFDRKLKKYDTLTADVAANVGRNAELLAAISRDAQVCEVQLQLLRRESASVAAFRVSGLCIRYVPSKFQ